MPSIYDITSVTVMQMLHAFSCNLQKSDGTLTLYSSLSNSQNRFDKTKSCCTGGKLIKLFLQDDSITGGDEVSRIEVDAFTEIENSEGGSNNGGVHCGRI